MEDEMRMSTEREFRRFVDRISALSCIRFLIVSQLIIKALTVMGITGILYVKQSEECIAPLKLFLGVHCVFTAARAVTFYLKNSSFFRISRVPDYEESSDVTLVNNFLEAVMLFWYIIGFHWIQECNGCKADNTLLYYAAYLCIVFGFFSFIAPLLAIILLLVLVSYVRPKLKVVAYQNPEDLPDDNHTCTICFDDYELGNRIKFLPCDHHFHADCIDEWFNIKDSCPLCKKHVNLLYDLVDSADPEI